MVCIPVWQAAVKRPDQAGNDPEDRVAESPYECQRQRTLALQSPRADYRVGRKRSKRQNVMDIAGHVSKQMLKQYSHIRMEAKRAALEAILEKPKKDTPENPSIATQIDSDVPAIAQKSEGESLQSPGSCGQTRDRKAVKPLKRFGSPHWTHFELLRLSTR